MNVVAILGGLGSQMFKYAFYLSLKEGSGEECYIDTTPFYMADMWNGYELQRIFGIDAPDIVNFYSDDELNNMKDYKYGYRKKTLTTMKKIEPHKKNYYYIRGIKRKWSKYHNFLYAVRSLLTRNRCEDISDEYDKEYLSARDNIFFDEFNHTSDKYIKNDNHDLKEVFKFPEFRDLRNKEMSSLMLNKESIAIHIRRSDHLYDNGELISNGYYQKAVKYMKEKVKCPVFFIFSEDVQWCRNNLEVLGLKKNDSYYFVDWNQKEDSYCDMQLMTYCKHNILAISSFSWWGYYLSKYDSKIVCAPQGYWSEVMVHF